MALKNFLLAGFGGQGILFSGKVIAYSGLMDGKEVSWLPSYGPEMRGGTANCSVCISDEPIGSPLVLSPDVLMAMNLQSFDKFINTVVPGGIAVIDSTLVVKRRSARAYANLCSCHCPGQRKRIYRVWLTLFDCTFLNIRSLPILRQLKKRSINVFHPESAI